MKLILFFFLMLPLAGNSQNNCEHTFIDSSALNKADIYKHVRLWVSKIFIDSKDAIELDDKELGSILCKGRLAVPGAKNFIGTAVGNDYISFTLTVDIKDFKYRIVFNELVHKAGNYDGGRSGGSLCNEKPAHGGSIEFSKKRWQKVKEQSSEKIAELMQQLQSSLKNKDNF
jgi:hypothetical protein